MKKLILIFIFSLSACTTAPKEDETTFKAPPSSEEVMKDEGDVDRKIDSKVFSTLKYPSTTTNIMVGLHMPWAEVDDCRDAISKSGARLHPGPALVSDVYFSATANLAAVRKLARLKCVHRIELEKKIKNLPEPTD